MNVVDVIILIFLLFGAVIGFKKGVIKSAVSFIGTLLVIVMSFKLKNPVSSFLYMNLPFFDFSGELAGITVINILIYEAVAFLVVFAVLSVLLKIVVFASGIVEKLLRLTIVFGFFSKILGLVFGFIEHYLIVFCFLFLVYCFNFTIPMVKESEMANNILMNTPILKGLAEDNTKAIKEIIDLGDVYKNDKKEYNKKAFEILIKYDILNKDEAKKLIDNGKLSIALDSSIDALLKNSK